MKTTWKNNKNIKIELSSVLWDNRITIQPVLNSVLKGNIFSCDRFLSNMFDARLKLLVLLVCLDFLFFFFFFGGEYCLF